MKGSFLTAGGRPGPDVIARGNGVLDDGVSKRLTLKKDDRPVKDIAVNLAKR